MAGGRNSNNLGFESVDAIVCQDTLGVQNVDVVFLHLNHKLYICFAHFAV